MSSSVISEHPIDPSVSGDVGGNAVQDINYVDSHSTGVKCDGGNAALGHPAVYYSFDLSNHITCQYCDRVFVRK